MRKLLAIVPLILMFCATSNAAVTFDAASHSTDHTAASSFSWTHTPVANPLVNGCVVVGVGTNSTGFGVVMGVTYGGTSMTFIREDNDLALDRTDIYALPNPPNGAQTVTVTMTGTANEVGAGADTFQGADQTSCVKNATGANGTTSPASVSVTSASGDIVFSTFVVQNTPASGNTQDWNVTGSAISFAGSHAPGAATVSMSWTWTGTSAYALSAVDVFAASGGGGVKRLRGAVITQ